MGGDCSQKAHAPEGTATPLRGAVSVRLQPETKPQSQAPPPSPFRWWFTVSFGGSSMENGWQSGGGLWWRPTRQGITGRRLIKTMGLGAQPTTASPRRFNPEAHRIDRSAH